MANDVTKNLDARMEKTVEAYHRELATLRAGRANLLCLIK